MAASGFMQWGFCRSTVGCGNIRSLNKLHNLES